MAVYTEVSFDEAARLFARLDTGALSALERIEGGIENTNYFADAANGRTVLFATHYLEEADAFADRIVLIAGGRIVADGPTADIRNMAGRRVVSAIVDDADLTELTRVVPGVEIIERRGGRTYLAAPDSDVLARALFNTPRAREVEIAGHNLEDAFLTLTAGATRAEH